MKSWAWRVHTVLVRGWRAAPAMLPRARRRGGKPRGRGGCPVMALAGLCMNLLAAFELPAQVPPDSAQRDSVHVPQMLTAVVSTASRRLQRVTDAPVTTEVVSRSDIERSGASNLNALLTQFVGLQPQPSAIGSGGIQMQGLSSERVMVLIDGQPLVGRIDGELDLSRVPTWMVDHVEVIKGPLSTLYGSAAMGGVVNIITRSGLGGAPMMRAAVTGGTQGRLDADAALEGGGDRWTGTLGAGRRGDDVQPGRTDQRAARTGHWDANGKFQWMPGTSGLKVDASMFGVLEDQRWQTGQLYNFSNNTQLDSRMTVSGPVGSARSGELASTLYYSTFSHLSRESTLPEPVTDSGDFSRAALLRGEVTYSAPLGRGTVDAGLDLDHDVLASPRITLGRRTDWTAEPFAQYTVHWGPVSLVPGARVSYSSQWGTHFTPKLATMTRLGGGFRLRASAGAGYRAPAFKEQYLTFLNGSAGYVVHGNPDLSPETSRNISGGLEWTGARTYARFQAYGNWFSGFIEDIALADSAGLQSYTYANVAHGITRGVDLDAGVAWAPLSLDASFGYVEGRDRGANLPLLGVTPQSGRVSAAFRLPAGFRPSVTALYWGRAPASFESQFGATTVVRRGAFTRVDFNVQRALAEGVEANIGVTNLLDAHPLLWPGTTARRIYAGVTATRGF